MFFVLSFPIGWYSVVNQEGKECAMTLTSMGQLAAARVPAFLSKFDISVYKLSDGNGKKYAEGMLKKYTHSDRHFAVKY